MNNFFQKKNSTKGYEVLLQSYPPKNFSQPYSLFSNYLQLQKNDKNAIHMISVIWGVFWGFVFFLGGGGYKNAAAIKHFCFVMHWTYITYNNSVIYIHIMELSYEPTALVQTHDLTQHHIIM